MSKNTGDLYVGTVPCRFQDKITFVLIPDTDASHSRIDFHMDFGLFSQGISRFFTQVYHFGRTDGLDQAVFCSGLYIKRRYGTEDKDRDLYSRFPQLYPFADRGNSKHFRSAPDGCAGSFHGTVSV